MVQTGGWENCGGGGVGGWGGGCFRVDIELCIIDFCGETVAMFVYDLIKWRGVKETEPWGTPWLTDAGWGCKLHIGHLGVDTGPPRQDTLKILPSVCSIFKAYPTENRPSQPETFQDIAIRCRKAKDIPPLRQWHDPRYTSQEKLKFFYNEWALSVSISLNPNRFVWNPFGSTCVN